MIVWGGWEIISYFESGGRYDPAADSWTPTSTGNGPTARYGHIAAWTGSLMIVWGGLDSSFRGYLDTGGRYDPATDTWTPTSTLGAPRRRSDHVVVWTGSLMIVWGGLDSSFRGYLDTGGRYDPMTDSWTSTSPHAAPTARRRHTAVWTGSLMVVWGGFGGGSYQNTGARYDPVTNTWTPTSTVGAPKRRSGHTAVWARGLMVVWGGLGGGYLNSGGLYDPSRDRWGSMSTVDAPEAREFHTAVWTGSEMLVWGGYPGLQNTGGRYDPVTNRWTPTSTVGAPTARYVHTTVWTGSRMIVWGGYDFNSALNTGGRYDPTTDSWTSTSTLGAPTARYVHKAVWTGSLMIVWGGAGGGLLSTGGRYALDQSVDNDGDGYGECDADCDDTDPNFYPGAVEVCDGRDNNCDGAIDEGCRFVPGHLRSKRPIPDAVGRSQNRPRAAERRHCGFAGERVLGRTGANKQREGRLT